MNRKLTDNPRDPFGPEKPKEGQEVAPAVELSPEEKLAAKYRGWLKLLKQIVRHKKQTELVGNELRERALNELRLAGSEGLLELMALHMSDARSGREGRVGASLAYCRAHAEFARDWSLAVEKVALTDPSGDRPFRSLSQEELDAAVLAAAKEIKENLPR